MKMEANTNWSNTCGICGKHFAKPALLRRHQVVHTKLKPFACASCPSCFSQQSSLQRHIQSKHAAQSSEDCDQVVAEHALAALKHLQSGMSMDSSCQEHPEKASSSQATLEEQPPCELVQLRDKLQPAGEVKIIATQRIQRSINSSCYYVCEYCAKEFSKTYDLIRHRRSHTKERPYKCERCIKRFANRSKLTEHHNRTHVQLLRHICKHCAASYSSKRQLHAHLTRQHNNLIYNCDHCSREFRSKTAYEAHRKRESDREMLGLTEFVPKPLEQAGLAQRCFKCVYCSKIFKRKFNCRSHMFTHLRRLLDNKPEESQPSVNAWQLLPISGGGADSINYELRLLPNKTCAHCSRSFQKPSDLARHLRTHNGLKPHACAVCQKCFTLKSTLQRHLQTHQAQRPLVNCQVCGKAYASKTALQLHLRLHTGARPFKCEICAQTFRTSGHKIEHMRGERHKSDTVAVNSCI